MVSISLSFALGIWLLQQRAALPDFAWAWLLAPLALSQLLPQRVWWQRIARFALLAVLACTLGFFYAAWVAQQRLTDELPATWQGKDIALIGVVAEMPRQH